MDVNLQRNPAVATATPAPAPPPAAAETHAPREVAVAEPTPRPEVQEDAARPYRVTLREEDITEQMLNSAFDNANRALAGGAYRLSYRVHEATNRVMVNVYNSENEIIREIPPESRLETFARIAEFTGLLFDQVL